MSIAPDTLARLTHAFVHKDCPDGVASAILLADAGLKVRAVGHADLETLSEDAVKDVHPSSVVFCDIAPPASVVDHWFNEGAVVLDHHEGSKELVRRFEEAKQGVFADLHERPGVSGAWLAFEHVWLPRFLEHEHGTRGSVDSERYQQAKRFARLAGIRDTWQTKSLEWEESCEQAAALLFWPFESWVGPEIVSAVDGPDAFTAFGCGAWDDELGNRIRFGKAIRANHLLAVDRAIEMGQRLPGTGRCDGEVYLIEGCHLVSDAAERVPGCSMLVAFNYEKNALRLSFRRRNPNFPVSALDLARSVGGGGHVDAAGASVPGPFVTSPHALVSEMIVAALRNKDHR